MSGEVVQAKDDLRVRLDAESVARLHGSDLTPTLATFPKGQASNVQEGDEVQFVYDTTKTKPGYLGPCNNAPPIYKIDGDKYHYLIGNARDVVVTKRHVVAEVDPMLIL